MPMDIKHYKTHWRARLWYLFFGRSPIVWRGRKRDND